ncbi:gag-pol polyprotein [Hordeum vulgare]|nr:gag-pol polyprotein [Hordeum vulgare]
MSKLDKLHGDALKSDFTVIPLCAIDYAESTMTLFEDSATMTTSSDPLMEHALEASDKVASKDDASIFGGESDDVPSFAFIHGDSDDMVEHGIFPSTITAFGYELRDFCHHIESESDFTTSPICDDLPEFPCEEIHNPHHLSEMSDSTICAYECNYLEGVSESQPHRVSEVVDRACEAMLISNNLMPTSIVSSPFVLGPLYDDAPILDDFVLPLDKMMAMVDDDAPPTWFHHDDDEHELVFVTSPTPHDCNEKCEIGEGDALVPLVDYLKIDCLHDVDHLIDTSHAMSS